MDDPVPSEASEAMRVRGDEGLVEEIDSRETGNFIGDGLGERLEFGGGDVRDLIADSRFPRSTPMLVGAQGGFCT